jgi:hypothetical protein
MAETYGSLDGLGGVFEGFGDGHGEWWTGK